MQFALQPFKPPAKLCLLVLHRPILVVSPLRQRQLQWMHRRLAGLHRSIGLGRVRNVAGGCLYGASSARGNRCNNGGVNAMRQGRGASDRRLQAAAPKGIPFADVRRTSKSRERHGWAHLVAAAENLPLGRGTGRRGLLWLPTAWRAPIFLIRACF